MSNALRKPVDLGDYLAAEESAVVRHEYLGGHIYAMTGGTLRHNRIAGNIYARLLHELAGTPCQVFINDVKLHVQASDCVYYPDVLVHCGGGPAGDVKLLSDAALIVEVLSESTAQTDRREKRAAYQRLPGLHAYWIISQDEQRAELHLLDADGSWGTRLCSAGDCLPAPGLLAADFPLAAAYTGTDLA